MNFEDRSHENDSVIEEPQAQETVEKSTVPEAQAEENAKEEITPVEDKKEAETIEVKADAPSAKKPWRLIAICLAVLVFVIALVLVLTLGGKDKAQTPDNDENANDDNQSSACSHVLGEWITDVDATCTTDGLRHKECTICQQTVAKETISAKGHTNVSYPAKSPTCDSIGWNEYFVCSTCNYTDYSPINPVHNLVDGFCNSCNSRLIMTAEELIAINTKENMSRSFVLGADIDLGGREWTPIGKDAGQFSGKFNGSVYTISNFKISSACYVNNTWCAGFIAFSNGEVKNVTLKNFVIDIEDNSANLLYVGSVVGVNSARVENCQVSDASVNVEAKTLYLGGIVGGQKINSTISSSTANIVIDGLVNGNHITAGGICGHNNGGKIMDSAFIGKSISGSAISETQTIAATVGGIVGKSQGEAIIMGCYSTGEINALSSGDSIKTDCYAGGIAGSSWGGKISLSYATGNVSAKAESEKSKYAYAGGLVAHSKGEVINCYATGNVKSECVAKNGGQSVAAGLVANNDGGQVSKCYAAGNVEIVGYGEQRCKSSNIVAVGAAAVDCFYVAGQSFTINTGDKTLNTPTSISGTEVEKATLLSSSFLMDSLGFGADEWVVSGNDHPTLK